MGCHSDTGYVHQARGFSSQLLYGESFEAAPGEPHTWQATIHAATANATVELLSGDGLHGQTALHLKYNSGHGLAALANRGLHNEGLYLQKGKTYEGPPTQPPTHTHTHTHTSICSPLDNHMYRTYI